MKSLLKEKFRIQGFDSLARSLDLEGHPILKRESAGGGEGLFLIYSDVGLIRGIPFIAKPCSINFITRLSVLILIGFFVGAFPFAS
jgi:hypothetical protein